MKHYFVIIVLLGLHSGIFAAQEKGFGKVTTLACSNGNLPKGLKSVTCSEKGAELTCNKTAIACKSKDNKKPLDLPVIEPKGFDAKAKGLCGNKKEDQDDFVTCIVAMVPPTCVNPDK